MTEKSNTLEGTIREIVIQTVDDYLKEDTLSKTDLKEIIKDLIPEIDKIVVNRVNKILSDVVIKEVYKILLTSITSIKNEVLSIYPDLVTNEKPEENKDWIDLEVNESEKEATSEVLIDSITEE